MDEWAIVVRWVHVLAGAAWFGQVVVINLVLAPALGRLERGQGSELLRAVFPRIFSLASWLSIVAVTSGFLLLGKMVDWRHWDLLVESRWGRSILTGGALGLGLTLFHHLVERRLSPVMAGNPSGLVYVEQRLRVVPRVGMLVLLVVMGAMMYAARGF
jgi:uncharacterized membrane protein